VRTRILHRESFIERPLEDVFAFFSSARNLERITPPWLSFRVLSPEPIRMEEGRLIDYRLRLRGLPLSWRSRIDAWSPPERFVDRQVKGPYRLWVHEHRFLPEAGGTRVIDRVEYAVPGGDLVARWLVRPDLERIFAYREMAMRGILCPKEVS